MRTTSRSAKGYTGSVLIVNGSERETVQLAPSGDSALKGEAKKPIAKGSSITLMLKTDAASRDRRALPNEAPRSEDLAWKFSTGCRQAV